MRWRIPDGRRGEVICLKDILVTLGERRGEDTCLPSPTSSFANGPAPRFHEVEIDVDPFCLVGGWFVWVTGENLVDGGDADPGDEEYGKDGEDDGLEDADTFGLGEGADSERENGGTSTAECGCESDGGDVEVGWECLCGYDDSGGE